MTHAKMEIVQSVFMDVTMILSRNHITNQIGICLSTSVFTTNDQELTGFVHIDNIGTGVIDQKPFVTPLVRKVW